MQIDHTSQNRSESIESTIARLGLTHHGVHDQLANSPSGVIRRSAMRGITQETNLGERVHAELVERRHWRTFDDLLGMDPKPWLFDRFIGEGDLVFLAGTRGTGKTFVALDLATKLAMGKPIGEGLAKATRPGKVVYFAGEKQRGLPSRAQAVASTISQDERELLNTNFKLNFKMPRLRAHDGDGALIELIDDIKLAMNSETCDLIVIDTLSNATAGMAENSSGDVTLALESAKLLRAQLNATVLFLHHPPKSGDEGLRGSGVMEADADTVFNLLAEDDVLRLRCTKQGDDARMPDIDLQLVKTDPSMTVKWIGYSDEIVKPVSPVKVFLESDPTEWRTVSEVAEATGMTLGAVRMKLLRDVDNGSVEMQAQVRPGGPGKSLNCYRLVQK